MIITPSNRIHPFARIVAAIVVPVLVLAFLILYLFPDQSGTRFAWAITPNMTAMYMGAGYLGGAYLFFRVAQGGPWHRVAPGFLPVTVFTVAMLVVTVLHWDRFDLRHFPFQLWLVLYLVTPFLIPFLWAKNRREDPGVPENGDTVVPALARVAMSLAGVVIAGFALVGLVSPAWLIGVWVWPLTPLTARVLAGWLGLLAAGGLLIGRETRWSAWKIGLVSIGSWHALVLLAAFLNPGDFPNGAANWYTIAVAAGLAAMAGLAFTMRKKPAEGQPPGL